MITTILEVLVAVVVLIVIIAVAALHFLRADDSDTFDDIPEEPRRTRGGGAGPGDEPERSERGRSRRLEPLARDPRARDPRASDDRGARQPAGRAPAYSERGRPRPPAQERLNSQGRPVPVGARPGMARPASADSGATGWDSMSDVDYWAELSADKPFATADTQALPSARLSRRGSEPRADAARPGDLPAARTDSAPPSARQRSQPRPRYEPATQNLAALARLGDQQSAAQRPSQQSPAQQSPAAPPPAAPPGMRPGMRAQRPAGSRQAPLALPSAPAAPRAAQGSRSSGPARPPRPMDDDPLTSPSFPAVNTSDSRSYRTRSRSGSGSYPEPGVYPDRSDRSDRSVGATNGHPVQPAAPGNPYGSYVSAPSYPEPASRHLDPAAYGTGYAAGQQAVAAANWYTGDADGSRAIDGYGPSAGQGTPGYGVPRAADYGSGYQAPVYPGGQSALPGGSYGQHGYLAGQYDRDYRRPDSAAPDGYEAYPGYGGAAR